MSVIKLISVYNGSSSSWGEPYEIGAKASNISLSSNLVGSNNLETVLASFLPSSTFEKNKTLGTNNQGKIYTIDVDPTSLSDVGSAIESLNTSVSNLAAEKAPMVHTSSSSATYGAATTALHGHVKIVDNLTTTSVSGLALSAKQGSVLASCFSSYAPKVHAVGTSATYGPGTTANYGHVKIVDDFNSDLASHVAGLALSPRLGKNLDNRVTTLNSSVSSLNTKTANLGKIYSYSPSSSVNTTSGTVKNLGTITVPKGTYVLVGQIQYADGTAAMEGTLCQCMIANSSTATSGTYADSRVGSVQAGNTIVSATAIQNFSATTTVYLDAKQSSGSSRHVLSGYTFLKAIKIL